MWGIIQHSLNLILHRVNDSYEIFANVDVKFSWNCVIYIALVLLLFFFILLSVYMYTVVTVRFVFFSTPPLIIFLQIVNLLNHTYDCIYWDLPLIIIMSMIVNWAVSHMYDCLCEIHMSILLIGRTLHVFLFVKISFFHQSIVINVSNAVSQVLNGKPNFLKNLPSQ